MATIFQTKVSPFSNSFLSEFVRISKLTFSSISSDSLIWRLESMPDVTVFTASIDDKLIAFKAGYAATDNRYYSWLGGTDPHFRKKGIAKSLMANQHDWLRDSNYKLVETFVSQNNKPMLQLNHDAGLSVTGNFLKGSKPYFIMQKTISRDNRA